MSPFRAAFLGLSRMPPALLLLIIIGVAVVLTMMLTSKVEEQEKSFASKQGRNTAVVAHGPQKQVLFSRSYLPAGSKIENKELELRDVDELDAWDDAEIASTNVVGSTPKHAIPAHAQIRKIDFE